MGGLTGGRRDGCRSGGMSATRAQRCGACGGTGRRRVCRVVEGRESWRWRPCECGGVRDEPAASDSNGE